MILGRKRVNAEQAGHWQDTGLEHIPDDAQSFEHRRCLFLCFCKALERNRNHACVRLQHQTTDASAIDSVNIVRLHTTRELLPMCVWKNTHGGRQ